MAARAGMFGTIVSALTGVLVLLVLAVPGSSAEPVTVRFVATPDVRDPVNTGPSDGMFTYDSGLIPAAGGMVDDDVNGLPVTALSFRWGSTNWTTANAALMTLIFDANGGLRSFRIGGAPNTFNAIFHEPIDDFVISTPFISYKVQGWTEESFLFGRVTSPSLVTPEPGTLVLIASGLLLCAASMRARRNVRLRSPGVI